MTKKVGVISDTHGLLRPEAAQILRGVDAIIHAGDIGKQEVVDKLAQIAPLTVIKGNIDTGQWAEAYRDTEILEICGHSIYVIHNLKDLDSEPKGRFSVVISGHSHAPGNEVRDGVLYFNPGSAGPRRFKLPIALGMLSITAHEVSGEIVNLNDLVNAARPVEGNIR